MCIEFDTFDIFWTCTSLMRYDNVNFSLNKSNVHNKILTQNLRLRKTIKILKEMEFSAHYLMAVRQS